MNAAKKISVALALIVLISVAGEQALALDIVPEGSCGCAKRECRDCNPCKACRGKFQCGKACDKACKIVPATKTVTYTCWECVYETICLAGPSCGCQGTCGEVRTVKRLVRKTYTKEVPITKCEVTGAAPCSCGSSASCGCGSSSSEHNETTAYEPTASTSPLDGVYSISRLPAPQPRKLRQAPQQIRPVVFVDGTTAPSITEGPGVTDQKRSNWLKSLFGE